jgi:hypothetical protein
MKKDFICIHLYAHTCIHVKLYIYSYIHIYMYTCIHTGWTIYSCMKKDYFLFFANITGLSLGIYIYEYMYMNMYV